MFLMLHVAQIEYACLDAYAAALVYKEIGKFQDPIFGDALLSVPAAGTEVNTASSFISNYPAANTYFSCCCGLLHALLSSTVLFCTSFLQYFVFNEPLALLWLLIRE